MLNTIQPDRAGLPAQSSRQRLRQRVAQSNAFLVPGAANALTARIIEDLGFEAVYLTGAGFTNTQLGMPDLGLLSVTELADAAARISDVTTIPLVVDIDTRRRSTPTPASATHSTFIARCICSNGRVRLRCRSKTRSFQRNAAISPARALCRCPRCWASCMPRLTPGATPTP